MAFGALALFFVLSTIAAEELNNGQPGIVSYIVSNVTFAVTPNAGVPEEPVMSSVGILPLSEKNEKRLLVFSAIALSLLSLSLALVSERAKEFSLFYASGVVASFCALTFISIYLAFGLVIPVLAGHWLLRKSNK